ncbi:hypothetical protein VKT23_017794 [Stygiomarasmius scandens]|uniref:Uncharacterized protein n=1 Tax=Marasmiellus scandens TaxID=2682957 RepID=A0ABR1IQW9_9AGAR
MTLDNRSLSTSTSETQTNPPAETASEDQLSSSKPKAPTGKSRDFPYLVISPSTDRSPQGDGIQDRVIWAPKKKQYVIYMKIGDSSWNDETKEVKDSSEDGDDDDDTSNDPPESDNTKGQSSDPKGEDSNPKGEDSNPKGETNNPKGKKPGNSKSSSAKNPSNEGGTTKAKKNKAGPKKRQASKSKRSKVYFTHNPAMIYTASEETFGLEHNPNPDKRPGKKLQKEVFEGYTTEGSSSSGAGPKIFQVPGQAKGK